MGGTLSIMERRTPTSAREDDAPAPKFVAVLPPELAEIPEEPFTPLDLDAFEHWAKTGEGDPWKAGA
jgi:hypothetical protein